MRRLIHTFSPPVKEFVTIHRASDETSLCRSRISTVLKNEDVESVVIRYKSGAVAEFRNAQ